MVNLTPQQQRVADHFDGHGLVIAGPGSGKTTTLIEHVIKLIDERNISHEEVWIMAFNRDISSSLKGKLEKRLLARTPQITTVHSFILQQTLAHGSALLGTDFLIGDMLGKIPLKKLLHQPIAQRLRTRHSVTQTNEGKRFTVTHVEGDLYNQLQQFWLTDQLPSGDLFPKFLSEWKRLCELLGLKFFNEFAKNFLDAMRANPSFKQAVAKQRIIIDEVQDLNPVEHAILQEFHDLGVTFLVLGDDDQAVNDFRRASAALVRQFQETYTEATEFHLPRDKRCPREVLAIADHFVNGLPDRFAKEAGGASHPGKVDILQFADDQKELDGVVAIIEKYLQTAPIAEDEPKPKILVLAGGMGKSPSTSRLQEIIEHLRAGGIEDVSGAQAADPFDSDFGLAFKALIGLLGSKNKPFWTYAWLSIADQNLLARIMALIEECENTGQPITLEEAATRLAEGTSLSALNQKIEEWRERMEQPDFDMQEIINFIPAELEGRDPVVAIATEFQSELLADEENTEPATQRFVSGLDNWLMLKKQQQSMSTVHVTSYRKSKGLEADLVIVTSADTCDFPSNNPTKQRVLYVAATRAKKNLIFTFAASRTGARRFSQGRSRGQSGNPTVYRSAIIPGTYRTDSFNPQWLDGWHPIE